MDHVAYGEIHKHLSDTTFYRKLSHNPTALFEQQIRNKLDLLLETGEILKVEHTFMLVDFYSMYCFVQPP